MERFLWKLVGALPLVAACSCPDQKIIRAPSSLAGMTVPMKLAKEDCERLCGPGITKCEPIRVSSQPLVPRTSPADVEWTVMCSVPPSCIGGRRPAGLDGVTVAGSSVGEHFAELARLEAASVQAFLELAGELELHGAPRALIEAARRAALEEIEHAHVTTRLARRYGVEPAPPAVAPTPPRALFDVLVENATEGLVLERYGAALAAVRARHASDPAVRAAMRTIAREEAGHAALSEAVHAWGTARVSRGARRHIAEARARTVDALRGELDREPSAPLAVLAGMPSATRAVDLLAAAV